MKYFERLVKDHIILPDTLYRLQFAYRPNRSTDNAISIALHTVLLHLDKKNTYVRIMFIDYSSAFKSNQINWVLDFHDGPPPGGEGRKQHLHFADPQHRGPTRVRLQLNHQFQCLQTRYKFKDRQLYILNREKNIARLLY